MLNTAAAAAGTARLALKQRSLRVHRALRRG
jgi:hypothetical protein